MRLKLIYTCLFLLCICFLISVSCSSDIEKKIDATNSNYELTVLNRNSENLQIYQDFKNFKITFKTSKSDKLVKSELIVVNNNDEIKLKTNYLLDTVLEDYKLKQANKVLKEANSLKSIDLEELIEINRDLGVFFNAIIKNLYTKEIDYLLRQLYFHKSILSIKERQLKNTDEDCECTTHPGYLINRTGFVCQEDFMIPVSILKEISNSKSEVLFGKQGGDQKVFKKYINGYLGNNEDYISFDKFYSFFVSKERYKAAMKVLEEDKDSFSERCWFGQGSSHGCCGNYKGCCYYWHVACYVHDKMCTKCEPAWFCLPGCKPDKLEEYIPGSDLVPEGEEIEHSQLIPLKK